MLAILLLLVTLLFRKESEFFLVCGVFFHFLFLRENIIFCWKKNSHLKIFDLKLHVNQKRSFYNFQLQLKKFPKNWNIY